MNGNQVEATSHENEDLWVRNNDLWVRNNDEHGNLRYGRCWNPISQVETCQIHLDPTLRRQIEKTNQQIKRRHNKLMLNVIRNCRHSHSSPRPRSYSASGVPVVHSGTSYGRQTNGEARDERRVVAVQLQPHRCLRCPAVTPAPSSASVVPRGRASLPPPVAMEPH